MLRFDMHLYKKAKIDISKYGFTFKNIKYFITDFTFNKLEL